MAWTKVKLALASGLSMALIGIAVAALLAAQRNSGPRDAVEQPMAKQAGKEQEAEDIIEISSPVEGQLVFLATEIRPGDRVEARDVITRKVGADERKYRRLRRGDKVEQGQLLAQVDDREARQELAFRKARLNAARSEERAAHGAFREGESRYNMALRLKASGAISNEDLAQALLVKLKLSEEHVAKKEQVGVVEEEVNQAILRVELHQIRSPVNGTIVGFVRRPGEAVRKYEALMRIRLAPDEP